MPEYIKRNRDCFGKWGHFRVIRGDSRYSVCSNCGRVEHVRWRPRKKLILRNGRK